MNSIHDVNFPRKGGMGYECEFCYIPSLRRPCLTGLILLVGVVLWGLSVAALKDGKKTETAVRCGIISDGITAHEMSEVVASLRPSLEPEQKIAVPGVELAAPHIYRTPSGREVYLN